MKDLVGWAKRVGVAAAIAPAPSPARPAAMQSESPRRWAPVLRGSCRLVTIAGSDVYVYVVRRRSKASRWQARARLRALAAQADRRAGR